MFRFRFPKRYIQTLLVAGGVGRSYRKPSLLRVPKVECLAAYHIALATENIHSPPLAIVLDVFPPIG